MTDKYQTGVVLTT